MFWRCSNTTIRFIYIRLRVKDSGLAADQDDDVDDGENGGGGDDDDDDDDDADDGDDGDDGDDDDTATPQGQHIINHGV